MSHEEHPFSKHKFRFSGDAVPLHLKKALAFASAFFMARPKEFAFCRFVRLNGTMRLAKCAFLLRRNAPKWGDSHPLRTQKQSAAKATLCFFGAPEGIRIPDLPLRRTFYTFFANAVWSLTTLQTRINTDFFSEHNVFSSLLFLLILRDDSNSN